MESEVKNPKIRNWQKARLMGFNLDINGLSDPEKILYLQMLDLRSQLLDYWDIETYRNLDKPMPLYKCQFCGKRSNTEYKHEEYIICKKHYKEFKDILE